MNTKMRNALLTCALLLLCTGCTGQSNDTTDSQALESSSMTQDTAPVDEPALPHMDVEQWLAYEIEFESNTTYDDPVYTVDMDVIFTNETTGTTLTLPAFWDGGTSWKVRYALTELGDWTYVTACSDEANTGLHGLSGTVSCTEYTGDLDIYKHGFLRVESGTRYFMYNDGTPFFYLGDTHWSLPMEDIDGIGDISQELADAYGITSQFKAIMDYRAEQGFTVIQSQPLADTGLSGNAYLADENGSLFNYGVNDFILEKFQELDRYFAYIAEKGFVHANAQFSYPTDLIITYLAGEISEEQIDKLCRYWVARYCAYPVLWTTAEEGDNDFYEREGCSTENNPWLIVMDSVAKYDPYDHPSSCHQENTGHTTVENSVFGTQEVHTWYAMQYNPKVKNFAHVNWDVMEEYWNNPGSKPVVNFEGHYDHFWCGTFKARAQGWIAFLNGQCGYGYGTQPIWSFDWYMNVEEIEEDEVGEYITTWNWVEGLYSEASTQLTYMKEFLTQYEWWNLVPCFKSSEYYAQGGQNYSVATIENKLYLGYFYGNRLNNENLGSLLGMENAEYEVRWMNCETGEWTEPEIVTIEDGTFKIPPKTDGDWAIAVKLIES